MRVHQTAVCGTSQSSRVQPGSSSWRSVLVNNTQHTADGHGFAIMFSLIVRSILEKEVFGPEEAAVVLTIGLF
jgi:hypothetical protein